MLCLAVVIPRLATGVDRPSWSTAFDGTQRLSTGKWGGDHIEMTVTKAGAHLELDCAAGDIAEPITVSDRGLVSTRGTVTPERPGPVRLGDEPAPKDATYSGQLNGKTLTLDVTLVDDKRAYGHFTLILGQDGRVRKCR